MTKVITLKRTIEVPPFVDGLRILFNESKRDLYLVGGAVRDSLMGNPIKDYDLATDATPDEIINILEGTAKLIKVGEKFGVINVINGDEEYEIATFRADSDESDGRRPDSVTFTDIKTDVQRRDFTINALFYDLKEKEIVDYVGGVADIEEGVIRTVGKAEDRFREDKLRILRAIRFATRTTSYLHEDIANYLNNGYDLVDISRERIRDEFIKSVKSANSVIRLMEMYDAYNMFEWIFPDLEINKDFIEDNDYMLVMGSLLSTNKIDVLKKRLNKLTYSTDEIRNVCVLITLLRLNIESAPLLKRVESLSSLSDTQIKEFGKLMDLSSNLIDRFCEYELSVKGDVVREKYGVEGPELGNKMYELEVEIFKNMLDG
jgi:tRNA nucleotidyltransferase/poly(A) polymerase